MEQLKKINPKEYKYSKMNLKKKTQIILKIK